MTKNALLLSVSLIFSLGLLGGCQSKPEITGEVDPVTGLHIANSSAFDKLALASPQKLSKYKAIYFAPLNLAELEVDTRRLAIGDRDWALSNTEKSKLSGYFNDSVIASFRDSSLPLARTPGMNVLTVEIYLTHFTPTAPKDDAAHRTARTDVFTYNVGTLEMTGWIRDSITGAVVGSIEDSHKVGDGPYLEKNDRVSTTRKLKAAFDQWTQGIATALSAFHNR